MGTDFKKMTRQMELSAQRLEYIDRLKGIAMLLVVIGHIIVFCGLGYENTFIRHITMMNMPLFYFLNGLVLKDVNGIKNGTKFLLSKSQQLLLPFFVWGWLMVLYRNATYLDFIQNYWKFGYWYLIVLFEFLIVHVILNIINQLVNKQSKWWLDLCLFLCIWAGVRYAGKFIPERLNIIMDYWQFLAYLPFFYMGTFFRRYSLTDKMISRSALTMTILLLTLLPVYLLWKSEIFTSVTDIILPVNIILILLMIFCLYEKEIDGQSNRIFTIANLSGNIGKHTFSIYMMQFFLFRYINFQDIFTSLYASGNYLLILFIASVTAVVLCYICIFCESVISKSWVLGYVLLGKRTQF